MKKYEVATNSKCIVITCYANLKKDDLKEFSRVLADIDGLIPTANVDAIILDFIGQTIIDHHFLRFMAPVLQAIRKHGKKFFAVNVPPASKKVISDNGLDQAIQVAGSVKEVTDRFGTPVNKPIAPYLDVNFINPFVEGVVETIKVQCQMEAKVGKPTLKSDGAHCTINFAIGGVVGYSIEEFGGYIAVCFPEKVFLSLMSKMLGQSYSQISSTIEDGAAEVLNMLCGHAKKILNEKNYGFELVSPVHVEKKMINNRPYTSVHAIPSVIKGDKIKEFLVCPTSLLIPFELEDGSFCMEISTREENTGRTVIS